MENIALFLTSLILAYGLAGLGTLVVAGLFGALPDCEGRFHWVKPRAMLFGATATCHVLLYGTLLFAHHSLWPDSSVETAARYMVAVGLCSLPVAYALGRRVADPNRFGLFSRRGE